MERIRTYVINLPQAQERRESILKETGRIACLDVEMVNAVYGKELTKEEIDRLFDTRSYSKRYRRSVLPGEIGCTLSHQECYKRLLDSVNNFALILEDDACFVQGAFSENFSESVTGFMQNTEPLILLLHADFEYVGKGKKICECYDLYKIRNALYATAYLINRSAAQLLLKRKPLSWVADDWMLFRRWGISVYSIYPSVAMQQWGTLSSFILEKKRPSGKKRIFPRSLIECRLAYEKLEYLLLKKVRIIKHLRG